MTREKDRKGIPAICGTDRPHRLRASDELGLFGVRSRFTKRDLGEGSPRQLLEPGASEIEGNRERLARPGEVLVKLGRGGVERRCVVGLLGEVEIRSEGNARRRVSWPQHGTQSVGGRNKAQLTDWRIDRSPQKRRHRRQYLTVRAQARCLTVVASSDRPGRGHYCDRTSDRRHAPSGGGLAELRVRRGHAC